MAIVVIADKELRKELCGEKNPGEFDVNWIGSLMELPDSTEVIIDLQFTNSEERKSLLLHSGAKTIIINSVLHTLAETNAYFIRCNGWKTFLGGELIEVAAYPEKRKAVEDVFGVLGKKPEWVADEAGFITPRVISMIINEAYYALAENVSTQKEIDTAMKLGTNYPYGPFEWAEKIGIENIRELLNKLAIKNPRYQPAPGL